MVIARQSCLRILLLTMLSTSLSGCMGAPLAQQLLSSVVLNGADKIMTNAQEAQEREALNNRVLPNTEPDEYWASFVTAGFQKITPIEEPLPTASTASAQPIVEKKMQVSPFVRVEVWNMLIGDEKLAVLEKAYVLGDEDLPPRKDWSQLRVAIGAREGEEDRPIIFIVPNELGRLNSGQETIVELGNSGDLSIARYAAN